MDDITRINYLVGVYGYFQLSMRDVGLLDNKGRPPTKRKKMLSHEQDALAIYDWISDQLKHISSEQLRPKGRLMDKAVSKLLNDHKVINNYLLALLLLRAYIDEQGSKMEQILISGKINRLVDVVDGAISDEDFDVTIKKTTSRTADNLYRQYVGKAQLDDRCRDLNSKRFLKGK